MQRNRMLEQEQVSTYSIYKSNVTSVVLDEVGSETEELGMHTTK